MYVRQDSEGETFVVAVYVNDIILGGKGEAKLNAVKKGLSQYLEMKDLGPLHHFLGVKIVQRREVGLIWIDQPLYTEKILQRYGMLNCKPVITPVNQDVKLVASVDADDKCDQPMDQAIVGCLLYLATKKRPDIAYAVNSVARFSAKLNKVHWIAVK